MPCSRLAWPDVVLDAFSAGAGSGGGGGSAAGGASGGAGPTAGLGARSVDPELDQLSPREQQVLRLIARGYTYKEVAKDLTISAKTVESHVSSVLRKLQLSTRHELTKWATDRRLV
jgi:DNA-binding NarL/FixJ family response regulator